MLIKPQPVSIPPRFLRALRLTIAAIALLACFWGIWSASRAGASRLLANHGLLATLPAPAGVAVQISPSDAEVRHVRALVLADTGETVEAAREFERAVALRPHYYFLWLELGRARDRIGETEGALAAFNEAVRLAPYYAQPRWQLGNFLLRAGRREDAFAELRRAGASNPKLLPAVINLAWGMYNGDAHLVEQAVQPETLTARLRLARFFIARGRAMEATRLLRAAGDIPDQIRRSMLTQLLNARQFPEAFELWAGGRNTGGVATINDGGFESGIPVSEQGFGWRAARDVQAVRASLDANQPLAGARSLRLDFSGHSESSARVVSQLMLVEPSTRYRMSFTARTEEVLSIGLPVVVVIDANNGRAIGQSEALSRGTSDRRDYTVDFVTQETMRAVLISVQRQTCRAPCPIFGRVWLDAFSLARQP